MRLTGLCKVGVFSLIAFATPLQIHAANPKKIESGKTQVVAKLDGQEITISDLRSEMARIGISPGVENAERIALKNIINRTLLVRAAKNAELHRKPEAMRRMRAAGEQALADLYLGTASQPPEPTRTEIEDFMRDNPTLFAQRRTYTFSVLMLPTPAFEAADLTSLFDKSAEFAALAEHLGNIGIAYRQTSIVQPSNAFPDAIRKQLAQYSARDNIVIKGDRETQIMKITAIKDTPLASSDGQVLARRALLEVGANERIARLLNNLAGKARVSYYRPSAAPLPAEENK